MIYLGEQLNALENYSKQTICWLSIKIKGRKTRWNPTGHFCGDNTCIFCNGGGKKRSGLDSDFIGLFTNKLIESLIKSKPRQLFMDYHDLRNQYLGLPGKTITNFNKNCKALFVDSGYSGWFLNNKFNYLLAKDLDKHTCTYCNREYIFTYENKKGGKGMVPQFDHWYSKGVYPLLALSFYNLIPSCATCNTIKSNEELDLNMHLHPYVDKNISKSYRFSYYANGVNSNRIILKQIGLNGKGIDTAKALNIPMIYEEHSKKELQDLIDLKYKYSTNYLEILFKKTFGPLNISEQEKFRLIFGIELEEDNYHKRIMSKFKSDIVKKLLSIK